MRSHTVPSFTTFDATEDYKGSFVSSVGPGGLSCTFTSHPCQDFNHFCDGKGENYKFTLMSTLLLLVYALQEMRLSDSSRIRGKNAGKN